MVITLDEKGYAWRSRESLEIAVLHTAHLLIFTPASSLDSNNPSVPSGVFTIIETGLNYRTSFALSYPIRSGSHWSSAGVSLEANCWHQCNE